MRSPVVEAPRRPHEHMPVGSGLHHLEMKCLLVLGHFLHRKDRREGDVLLGQATLPLAAAALQELAFDDRFQLPEIIEPVGVAREARVREQVGPFQSRDETTPEFLGRGKVQRDGIAGGRQDAEILRLRMPRLPGRRFPRLVILGHRIDRDGGHRFQQRRLDHSARAAASFPPGQRGQDTHGVDHAAHEIGDACPGEARRLRVVHDRVIAADALAHGIIGGAVAHRAAVAEARHGGVDQRRIDRHAIFRAQPKLLHLAGPAVLHDHVEARQQGLHQGDALGLFKIDGDAALARVVLGEIGAAGSHAAPKGVAAVWRLHLDYVRAKGRKHHAGIRPGNVGAEFQYPKPGERQCSGHRKLLLSIASN